MKTMVNGIVRNMTPEEEADFIAASGKGLSPEPEDDATPEDYEKALNEMGVNFDDQD